MNQIERQIQVTIAQRTIQGADRELRRLAKRQNDLEKFLGSKTATLEAKAAAGFDLESLNNRIAAVEDRRFQSKLLIGQLDNQAANDADVLLISGAALRCQVVIQYTLDNGKKLSYTRHLHREGGMWFGLSTLSDNKVSYSIRTTAALAKAAVHAQAA